MVYYFCRLIALCTCLYQSTFSNLLLFHPIIDEICSISRVFKRASRINANLLILVGDSEWQRGMVGVKFLSTGEQQEIKLDGLDWYDFYLVVVLFMIILSSLSSLFSLNLGTYIVSGQNINEMADFCAVGLNKVRDYLLTYIYWYACFLAFSMFLLSQIKL